MRKLGIIQGRLVKSENGQLQCFPQKQWRKEFALASELGYQFIELISERQHTPHNPLWTAKGIKEIKSLAKENGLKLYALCDDYVIEHSLIHDASAKGHTFEAIDAAGQLRIQNLILPLFEYSELNERNAREYQEPLRELAAYAQKQKVVLCLETILEGDPLLRFLKELKRPNVKAVYDTGNRIAFGHDIYRDIVLLGKEIAHVHIKDKNKNNENVLLGTGQVDFKKVFESLKTIGYQGAFSFETTRGRNPLATARFNKMTIEFFMQETDF